MNVIADSALVQFQTFLGLLEMSLIALARPLKIVMPE
jgi:hypothetical protein